MDFFHYEHTRILHLRPLEYAGGELGCGEQTVKLQADVQLCAGWMPLAPVVQGLTV